MSRSHSEIRRPPPLFGQHTAEVLAEAGYSDAEIQELVHSGAVGVRARQGEEG